MFGQQLAEEAASASYEDLHLVSDMGVVEAKTTRSFIYQEWYQCDDCIDPDPDEPDEMDLRLKQIN